MAWGVRRIYMMLFSKSMIQGVYILCYLSRQDAGRVTAAGPIAEAMNVPPEQAAKVLQSMTRAGLVRSERGRRGGYALAKPVERLTLGEVFDALGPDELVQAQGVRMCPVADEQACSAYLGLVRLQEKIREMLGEQSLAPLLVRECEVTNDCFNSAKSPRNPPGAGVSPPDSPA